LIYFKKNKNKNNKILIINTKKLKEKNTNLIKIYKIWKIKKKLNYLNIEGTK